MTSASPGKGKNRDIMECSSPEYSNTRRDQKSKEFDDVKPATASGVEPNTVGAGRKTFYSRPSASDDPKGSSDADVNQMLFSSPFGSHKEYLFPLGSQKHQASFSNVDSSLSSTPRKFQKHRSHSISVTDPVCRSAYDSMPQSPATSFLAQFARQDEYKEQQPRIEEGSIIDKYKLGKIIGRGSFSECREGTCTDDNIPPFERLALKIVKDDGDGSSLHDFDIEANLWKSMKHKNILPLKDFLRMDNARIAVSPMAELGTLYDYLDKNGPFSEDKARIVFRQIAEAVDHMHSQVGIIHRDIKLDNILLDANLRPFLCDFGLSEKIYRKEGTSEYLEDDAAAKKRTEDEIYCKGSLWYLPPEELELSEGNQSSITLATEIRKKGDVWAIGICLYAMISGKLPFTDDFIPRLQLKVSTGKYPPLPENTSAELRDLISKLIEANVDKRLNTKEVLDHPWMKEL